MNTDNLIVQLVADVATLNAKMDSILTAQRRDLEAAEKIEDRIQALEKFRWQIAGGTAVAVFLSSIVTMVIDKFWKP